VSADSPIKRVLKIAFSYPAAVCYLAFGTMLATTLDNGRGIFSTLVSWTLQSVIASWLITEARRAGRKLCYDYDTFLMLMWPIAGPVLLLRTRGWRGLLVIAGFVALCALATAASWALLSVAGYD